MGVVSRVRIAQVLVDRPSELDRPHLSPYVKIGIGLPSITASAPTGGRRLRRFMEAVMANTSEYRYTVSLTWTGNIGSGTSGYRDYSRDYEISTEGKPVIHGSADPAFRGDRSRWNPEELLVASLSACHKLWYLHLAAEAGIIVTAYADRAEGLLEVGRDGAGRFKSVVLRPTVTVAAGSDIGRARTLHQPAHEKCFIANSVNFPVECEPEIVSGG